MSEFNEDPIDLCRSAGDAIVCDVENHWNALLARGPSEEELLDSIEAVNVALREPLLRSHKLALQGFRKHMAERLVELRHHSARLQAVLRGAE